MGRLIINEGVRARAWSAGAYCLASVASVALIACEGGEAMDGEGNNDIPSSQEAAGGMDIPYGPSSVPEGYELPDMDTLAQGTPEGGLPTAAAPVSGNIPDPMTAGGGAGTMNLGPVTVSTVAGYSELPNGRGGVNIEQVAYTADMGFDKSVSLAAFETTVYPLLQQNCSGCHSSQGRGQAPMHSDGNVELAHEYALTRVYFRHPEQSKLVERMTIDRHNCFGRNCTDAGAQMLAAVEAWAAAVADMVPAAPRSVEEGVTVSEAEVEQWIAADRATLAEADAPYIKYASLHEMHNAGASADALNVARAGLSKALNSTARWAPAIVNPVDINGMGMVYRFDIRDYWGYNKGVSELIYGGSDDDIFFGDHTDVLFHRFGFTPTAAPDPQFALAIWDRAQQGSVDAYKQEGATANTSGFNTDYVEASQLVYTLSRPDVYNAIMSIPVYATELESELGVMKDNDIQSYEYIIVQEAITIDSRLVFRARTASGGFLYKTFDIFAGSGQVFPFWEHPIPKYVSAVGANGRDLSLIASLLQPANGEEPSPECGASGSGGFALCTNYTGEGGVQQSASEMIWDMPNGLQGYAIYGGLNQRRTDAFSFIVRDPRRLVSTSLSDDQLVRSGFIFQDIRLLEGGSCMSCHSDGMNRLSNDMRDWLDQGTLDVSWMGDAAMQEQVRTLYPETSHVRDQIEGDRRPFFDAMAQIRGGMLLGPDKNLYVEPIGRTFEWAQRHYGYAETVSN